MRYSEVGKYGWKRLRRERRRKILKLLGILLMSSIILAGGVYSGMYVLPELL